MMAVTEIPMSCSRCARSILMFTTFDILAFTKYVSFHLPILKEIRDLIIEDFYEFSKGFKRV